MYEESIYLLKQRGVEFASGLTLDELTKIEGIYNIRFPKSLGRFLMEGVPISKGFYNWGDFGQDNISRIKRMISLPIEQISKFADEIDWCEEWGEEPNDKADIARAVRERLECAPKLLPIYAHRYIPAVSDDDPPILSIHDTDVICYGENLKEYFKVEFGNKRHEEIRIETFDLIPFWSDIM